MVSKGSKKDQVFDDAYTRRLRRDILRLSRDIRQSRLYPSSVEWDGGESRMTKIYQCDVCGNQFGGQSFNLRYYIDREGKTYSGVSKEDICAGCMTINAVSKEGKTKNLSFTEKVFKRREAV